MNFRKIYMPVLKAKAGELGALKHLKSTQKDVIYPLLELPPTPWNYQLEDYEVTLEDHLKNQPNKIVSAWNHPNHICIDCKEIEDALNEQQDEALLVELFNTLKKAELKAVPVIHTESSKPFQNAMIAAIKLLKNGVCLRLDDNSFETGSLNKIIHNQMEKYDVKMHETDLLLDLGEISGHQVNSSLLIVKNTVAALHDAEHFRNIIVCATSFPKDLSDIPADRKSYIPRLEKQLWKKVKSEENALPRLPIFGDYAISNPSMIQLNPALMQMSASIRYTKNDDWLILKGRSVTARNSGGFQQFYTLCEQLVHSDDFYGAYFSWGDHEILEKANRNSSTGNATTWRSIGTNHHIAVVIHELSNLSD